MWQHIDILDENSSDLTMKINYFLKIVTEIYLDNKLKVNLMSECCISEFMLYC